MTTDNCFNFVGDCDDLDVLVSVENAFAVTISDSEAEGCETFGQLFDVVRSKLQGHDHGGLKCPSAVAFYKLRLGLRGCGFPGKITPATDLSTYFRQNGARKTRKELADRVELALPHLRLTSFSIAVLACVLAIGAVGSFNQSAWTPVLISICLSIGLTRLLPCELPDEVASMKDFTTSCTAWNFGHLASRCGGARSHDIWNALALVVRESSGTGFEGAINRETRFFPSKA